MFSILQNSLNVPDLNFVPASQIIFLCSPNSANVILATCTRSPADRPTTFLTAGNLL